MAVREPLAGGERECHEGSRWRPSPGSLAQPTTLLPRTGSTADRHLLFCAQCCAEGKFCGRTQDHASHAHDSVENRHTSSPLSPTCIALLLSPGFPVRERARFSATYLQQVGRPRGGNPTLAWSSQISGMERTRFPGGLLVCSRPRTKTVPFERAFCRSPNGSQVVCCANLRGPGGGGEIP